MYNHEPKDYICPFCQIAAGKETDINKRADIVFEDDLVIAYISPKWWPHNPGNVLIIPREHIENIYDIPDDLLGRIYLFGKQVALGMKETYKCDGVSFRQHNEPAGDQEVWHFHMHVFPRWDNDGLYAHHDQARWTNPEERLPYAEKLREYFHRA